jgi:hypothetical protein
MNELHDIYYHKAVSFSNAGRRILQIDCQALKNLCGDALTCVNLRWNCMGGRSLT